MVRKYSKPYKTKGGSVVYRVAKLYKKIQRKRRALMMNPLPMSRIVKHRYVDYITIAGGGVGAPGYYVFSANGMYDPNITGTGHQPMFRDTFAAMYNHYTVLGSKIKVKAWGELATGSYGAVLACKLDDDGSTTYNNGRIMEQGGKLVTYKVMRENALTGGASYCTLTKGFSAKKFFGIKDPEDNETVGALVGANPADQAYYVLHWQHPDLSTTVGTLKAIVQIDYICKWAEPADQVQS